MSEDRLITLAIHTYEKALSLKNILESEGVKTILNNVNLTSPSISSGVRVRINECDLPLALRIVENQDIFNDQNCDLSPVVLAPIDFSDYSFRASFVAFNFAKTLKSRLEFIHSFINYTSIDKIHFTNDDYEKNEYNCDYEQDAKDKFVKFSNNLKNQIKLGIIPPIKFATKLVEGVPEDSIIEYAKGIKPQLIIMGTRGTEKKERELIGSVTGEVLDGCRFPVLAIPETANITNLETSKHIVFFCNIEHEDIVALDLLYRLFPNKSFNITIIHVPHKSLHVVDSYVNSQKELIKYCQKNYPRFNFNIQPLSLDKTSSILNEIEKKSNIDLIVVPNKKKNVFSRFFNPSLAHKVLLHSDKPMMTIPI